MALLGIPAASRKQFMKRMKKLRARFVLNVQKRRKGYRTSQLAKLADMMMSELIDRGFNDNLMSFLDGVLPNDPVIRDEANSFLQSAAEEIEAAGGRFLPGFQDGGDPDL